MNGEHPEIGHISVDPEGPECYCGMRGCLESVASGTALTRAGQVEGFADAAEVFERAGAGDEAASLLVDRAILAVAVGLTVAGVLFGVWLRGELRQVNEKVERLRQPHAACLIANCIQ